MDYFHKDRAVPVILTESTTEYEVLCIGEKKSSFTTFLSFYMILNICYQMPFKSDKEFCCHPSDLSFIRKHTNARTHTKAV